MKKRILTAFTVFVMLSTVFSFTVNAETDRSNAVNTSPAQEASQQDNADASSADHNEASGSSGAADDDQAAQDNIGGSDAIDPSGGNNDTSDDQNVSDADSSDIAAQDQASDDSWNPPTHSGYSASSGKNDKTGVTSSSTSSKKKKSKKTPSKTKTKTKEIISPYKYKKASGKISQVMFNEKHKVVGGRRGDQTGIEVFIDRYVYNPSKPWKRWKFAIRCTDPRAADAAASFVTKVCKSNKFGYNNYRNNQKGINKRNSLYKEAKRAHFKVSKMRKTDTSCTPLCLTGYRVAGINMNYKLKAKYRCKQTGTYTGKYCAGTVNAESLKAAVKLVNKKYKAKGKKPPFKIITLSKKMAKHPKKYLKRGDTICTGHHTAMML